MKSKMSGIYCITNKINGKRYIGCSVNIEQRWNAHCSGKDPKSAIYKAIRKYGRDNFKFEIIMFCCQEWFEYNERALIVKYNTIAPNGYNLCDGGLGTYTRTEEWKEQARKSRLGKPTNLSDEGREKIRKRAIEQGGVKWTPEVRAKWTKSMEKIWKESSPLKGRTLTDETKQKIRDARVLQVTTKETREKMRASMIGKNVGKVRSEETKEKMRAAWTRRKQQQ